MQQRSVAHHAGDQWGLPFADNSRVVHRGLTLGRQSFRRIFNQEVRMEQISLSSVIEKSIVRFNRNRSGEKPPVFVSLNPALTQVPWKDRTLGEFLQLFLYESLLTSDPAAPIEIALRRRLLLKDLTAFVRIQPSYWVQIRISGRGLRIAELAVEDLFSEIGYRCEEWVGISGCDTRLGIFGTLDAPQLKIVFCIEPMKHRLRCDLLIPVIDDAPVPCLVENNTQQPSSRL